MTAASITLSGSLFESGREDQHVVADALPDAHDDDHDHRPVLVGEEVRQLGAEPGLRQPVEQALRLQQHLPDEHVRDHRCHDRNEEQHAQRATTADARAQAQRQQQREDDAGRDVEHGEHQRVPQRRQEVRVLEQPDVVRTAVEGSIAERRPVEEAHHDGQDDRHDREQGEAHQGWACEAQRLARLDLGERPATTLGSDRGGHLRIFLSFSSRQLPNCCCAVSSTEVIDSWPL
ncbi:hypothetical protein [Microbacterium suwonense]|uniref:hypothetical protein n=1 Tax=Microbacterium suwonense TaxID=683047 RepID=UPI0025744375|nr:hypothetical protein [Microbacterium suwonense]